MNLAQFKLNRWSNMRVFRSFSLAIILLGFYQHSGHAQDNWCIQDPANPPCDGAQGRCTRNQDGSPGGFVANTATVEQVSYAYFWSRNRPFIGQYAQVCDHAGVYHDAQVRDSAKIFENAMVFDNAEVFGNAQVSGDARVAENASIYEDAQIYDDAIITGDVQIAGDTQVFGNCMAFQAMRVSTGRFSLGMVSEEEIRPRNQRAARHPRNQPARQIEQPQLMEEQIVAQRDGVRLRARGLVSPSLETRATLCLDKMNEQIIALAAMKPILNSIQDQEARLKMELADLEEKEKNKRHVGAMPGLS